MRNNRIITVKSKQSCDKSEKSQEIISGAFWFHIKDLGAPIPALCITFRGAYVWFHKVNNLRIHSHGYPFDDKFPKTILS